VLAVNAMTVVVLAGVGSFLYRFSIVALIDRIATPKWLERVASFVVPAVFAGLAASALAGPVNRGGIDALAPVVAVAVTGALVVRGRAVPVAFASGLGSLWAVSAFVAIA
jgi:branched-subunit amino acid transport protein